MYQFRCASDMINWLWRLETLTALLGGSPVGCYVTYVTFMNTTNCMRRSMRCTACALGTCTCRCRTPTPFPGNRCWTHKHTHTYIVYVFFT